MKLALSDILHKSLEKEVDSYSCQKIKILLCVSQLLATYQFIQILDTKFTDVCEKKILNYYEIELRHFIVFRNSLILYMLAISSIYAILKYLYVWMEFYYIYYESTNFLELNIRESIYYKFSLNSNEILFPYRKKVYQNRLS